MPSSLTEAEQAAACFTLSFPTDCFLLRPIIYQGEHPPSSQPAGLAMVSGQRGSRSQLVAARLGSRGDTAGTGQPAEQERGVLPLLPVPPLPRMSLDKGALHVHSCSIFGFTWSFLMNIFGACSFLRDLTESISLLQVSCNH